MTEAVVAAELEPGTEIPSFERTTGLENWNRFAAVNNEFVGIHMDDEAGRAAGYPSAFGMGNLQWAYLHNLLRAWVGDDGRIVRVACQFRGPNLKDTVVTARGTITAVNQSGGETTVDLDVWTENAGGGKVATGTATVVLAGVSR
jgi:acyl dehydratase